MRKEAMIHISKNSNIKVVRKGPHVTTRHLLQDRRKTPTFNTVLQSQRKEKKID